MCAIVGAHPRSRGENFLAPQIEGHLGGLIPAHAGKTQTAGPSCSHPAAHPRSRGENQAGLDASLRAGGSSPLTRGKRRPGGHEAVRTRLIPAHAGKTSSSPTGSAPCGAHPRSRGENITINAGWDRLEGSSPLTRGKPDGPPPRALRRGSSPLTRGKRVIPLICTIGFRLIPAHAGKTRPTSPATKSPTAHPRSRGENTS